MEIVTRKQSEPVPEGMVLLSRVSDTGMVNYRPNDETLLADALKGITVPNGIDARVDGGGMIYFVKNGRSTRHFNDTDTAGLKAALKELK